MCSIASVSPPRVWPTVPEIQVRQPGQSRRPITRHQADLGNFFTSDPQGKQVLEFLAQLAGQLAAEQVAVLQELAGCKRTSRTSKT